MDEFGLLTHERVGLHHGDESRQRNGVDFEFMQDLIDLVEFFAVIAEGGLAVAAAGVGGLKVFIIFHLYGMKSIISATPFESVLYYTITTQIPSPAHPPA